MAYETARFLDRLSDYERRKGRKGKKKETGMHEWKKRASSSAVITPHRFINSVTLETRFVSPRLGGYG